MADGKHCPGCGKPIGVWPVFSALLPNRIWCPHCHSRLRYRKTTGVLLLILLVLATVVFIAYFAASTLLSSQEIGQVGAGLMVFGGVLVGVWTPVELIIALFLRNHKELECVSGGSGRRSEVRA